MFRNSRNSQGLSTAAGQCRNLILGLVLVLALGGLGQTSPVQAAPHKDQAEIYFEVWAFPEKPAALCIKQELKIYVSVHKGTLKIINDKVFDIPGGQVPSAKVLGSMTNKIGTLSMPGDELTSLVGSNPDFLFTAEKPGKTTLTFNSDVDMGGTLVKAKKAEIQVEVRNCKYKIKTNSRFSAQGITIMSTMDGEMKANEQGNFTGSATVNWVGSPSASGNCRGTIDIASSQADLTGSQDDSGQLAAEVTYLPAALTHAFCCKGICANDSALVTPDAVAMSVPSSGGVFSQSHNLYEPNFYSMYGSVDIVVIPVEDEAAAFIPLNLKANWDDLSSLLVLLNFQ